ncbi:MAG: NAD(+) synthase, partial [Elusimicrobia bacterium]|nr:NAD(+) synthase [Elusimicrobiota bacterium]
IKNFIRRAQKRGAEIVVFPQDAISGFPAWDLAGDRAFIDANLKTLRELARSVGKTACLVGYAGQTSSRVALIHKGKVVADFGETSVIKFKSRKIGISIGEPISQFAEKPDILINISASPYYCGSLAHNYRFFKNIALKNKIPVIHCNMAGANDELIFAGGSFALNAVGKLIAQAKTFGEDLITFDTSRKTPARRWQISNEDEEICGALVLGIKDFAVKCKIKSAVLGLSGGVDSAVVAALAVKALGHKNVTAISLPSRYTSKISIEDAKKTAASLKIKLITIPITGIFRTTVKDIRPFGKTADITEQNLQSRIRGNLLMAYCNQTGAMLLATGNKSEIACGYCTLYGDTCGALAPLADVYKGQVYMLAEHFKIPQRIISRPPTAELKHNQCDQDDLPPYPTLDKIIRLYIEESKTACEIIASGIPQKIVRQTLLRIDKAEFKRKQMPPGLKITAKSFIGRKMPVARGRF